MQSSAGSSAVLTFEAKIAKSVNPGHVTAQSLYLELLILCLQNINNFNFRSTFFR